MLPPSVVVLVSALTVALAWAMERSSISPRVSNSRATARVEHVSIWDRILDAGRIACEGCILELHFSGENEPD